MPAFFIAPCCEPLSYCSGRRARNGGRGYSLISRLQRLSRTSTETLGRGLVWLEPALTASALEKIVSEMPSSNERRRFRRITFDALTRLYQGDLAWDTQLLDISLRGILVKRPDQFEIADASVPFEATIKLEDGEHTIIMSLELAHQGADQLGFKCDYIDLESITYLKRLIELNLGNHESLERELSALLERD